MASCLQGKSRIDEAENSSPESLSFAGFLCIQDQMMQPTPGPTTTRQTHKQHSDFAFYHVGHDNDPAASIKYPPADLLISNGKVIPQAFVIHQKQRPSIVANQYQPRLKASKRSSGAKRGSMEKKNMRNKIKAEANNTSKSRLGWDLLKSVVSPCRECKVVKPSVKTKTKPRESFKVTLT